MNEEKNTKLILITAVLGILIFVIWDTVFLKPIRDKENASAAATEASAQVQTSSVPTPQVSNAPAVPVSTKNESDFLKESPRIEIATKKIKGSINLRGAQIDSITFLNYKETVEKDSNNVTLLHPKNTTNAYYYENGWVNADSNSVIDLPNETTLWSANKEVLAENSPVVLEYKNKQGVIFQKEISVDSNYMITVKDTIKNVKSASNINIYPWALVIRYGEPVIQDTFISHEGIVGYLNDELNDIDYKEVKKKSNLYYTSKNGYVGFSDKYWLISLIPAHSQNVKVRLSNFVNNNVTKYQIDYLGDKSTLQNGEFSNTSKIFVGPKEYNLLKNYAKKDQITKFDYSIDFGWFYFITRPFLSVLLFFYHHIGNFGIAMLVFTIIIRLILMPITYNSYMSMAKMRAVQPLMASLKEKHGSDAMAYNKALMALYKKEKINPLAGCLPMFFQIPILFSIYKVIFVCVEMRHSSFLWIKDLSHMDTTNLFNLFGLIPYNPPLFLSLGIWPILMGITMFFQQKLSNVTSANNMQQKMMNWFPLILTFILAKFPVGLIIYWVWSNVITIIQQLIINYIIKRKGHSHR